MENDCAPLPSNIIPQKIKTPMKGSDLDFKNMNNNNENSDSDDSGDFTPNNPNKISKPKRHNIENKIEILGKEIKPDLKFKVIIVGNMSVGKSCLTLRATEGIFKEDLGSTVPLSVYTFNVKINNTKISLQIWDTCGQEKYRGLTKIFYKDARIVILVYDVTRRATFEEIKNYWYNQIKENSPEEISKSILFNFNFNFIF